MKSINLFSISVSDIHDIVKAHGGKLKGETKESEASEFIIQLPILLNQ